MSLAVERFRARACMIIKLMEIMETFSCSREYRKRNLIRSSRPTLKQPINQPCVFGRCCWGRKYTHIKPPPKHKFRVSSKSNFRYFMLKGICVRMKCVLSDGKMRAFSVIKSSNHFHLHLYTVRVRIQNGISLTLISTNSVRPIHITACTKHLTHYYSVVYATPLERYSCTTFVRIANPLAPKLSKHR